MINGTTKLMGLIGNPVAHTLSPVIHNTIAANMGINMVYVPFPVTENLSTAVQGAKALKIEGMNVTVPYKTDVMESLYAIDEKAAMIGAVNTLVPYGNGYKGYNTDYLGLYQALLSEGQTITNQKFLIIGAGGSARAAAFLLAWEHAAEIIIINRTLERAKQIVLDVKKETGCQFIRAISLDEVHTIKEDGYFALQATKVGLSLNEDETPIAESSFFDKLSGVYDFIYKPAETRFMKLAKEKNIPVYNGLKMLLYQGVASFQLWNDVIVPKEVINTTYEKLKEELYQNE